MSSKTCRTCGQVKPLPEYHKDSKAKDGKLGKCKACVADYYRTNSERIKQYQRDRNAANPEAGREYRARTVVQRKAQMRDFQLKRYGLDTEGYERLGEGQEWACAICKRPETTTRNGVPRALCIDHDHACCPGVGSCGKCIRGLLCNGCNRALGYMDDRLDLFIAATEYLMKYEDRKASA